jgi:hypothetical protein
MIANDCQIWRLNVTHALRSISTGLRSCPDFTSPQHSLKSHCTSHTHQRGRSCLAQRDSTTQTLTHHSRSPTPPSAPTAPTAQTAYTALTETLPTARAVYAVADGQPPTTHHPFRRAVLKRAAHSSIELSDVVALEVGFSTEVT